MGPFNLIRRNVRSKLYKSSRLSDKEPSKSTAFQVFML